MAEVNGDAEGNQRDQDRRAGDREIQQAMAGARRLDTHPVSVGAERGMRRVSGRRRSLRHAQSRIGRSAPSLTRSRRSLPGLKCGTCLPESATASPVLGLRPWRGGRKCSEKLPKPRISMRSPCESASLMISRICFSASSTSLAGRCFCLAVMISMSSDFVMAAASAVSVAARADVLLEQVAEAGAARRRLGTVALHRLGLVVRFLRLDRQRNGARLAVDAGELGLDLVPDLEHRARVLDTVAAELGGAQLALDAVAQVDDRA